MNFTETKKRINLIPPFTSNANFQHAHLFGNLEAFIDIATHNNILEGRKEDSL